MSRRTIYYAQKALKLLKLSEKDKATFTMYKAEAFVQLGNKKQGLQLINESVFPVQDCALKCSFGYATPWVDRSIDYTPKQLVQINLTAAGLTDENESQTKEVNDSLKALAEATDPKLARGVTPIPTLLLYSYLRKGKVQLM